MGKVTVMGSFIYDVTAYVPRYPVDGETVLEMCLRDRTGSLRPAGGGRAGRYPVPECAGEQPLAAHGRRARPFRSALGICRCRPAGRRRFRPETEPGLRKTLDENPQKG